MAGVDRDEAPRRAHHLQTGPSPPPASVVGADRAQIWEDLSRLVMPQGNFAVYRKMLKTAPYVCDPATAVR